MIIILIILCFFKTSLCFLRQSSPDATLIGTNGIRFTQKELLKKNSEVEKKMKITEKIDQNVIKYNGEVIIVKETDSIDDKPITLNNYIVFGTKSIDLYSKDLSKIEKSIKYLK
jgi:hypothetical protein